MSPIIYVCLTALLGCVGNFRIPVAYVIRESHLTDAQKSALLYALVQKGMTEEEVLVVFGRKPPFQMGIGFSAGTFYYLAERIRIDFGTNGKVISKLMQPALPMLDH
jgi:hypothetical protein